MLLGASVAIEPGDWSATMSTSHMVFFGMKDRFPHQFTHEYHMYIYLYMCSF